MSNDAVTPPKPGLGAWLSNANNLLTTGGAIVAGLAAILSTCNKAKIEEINSQVRELEVREKKEKASSDFANVFLDKVLKDQDLIKNEKRLQALLSIVNLVAQASSSETGNSNPKARALMPIQLALLLGQPGGVAAMDTDYRYLDDWVAIAYADNSNQTRVTAIQALGGVCQRALLEGRLDVLSKGVKAVDQLVTLIPEEQAALRGSATAARAQLAFFIQKEHALLASAKLDPRDLKREDVLRGEIENAFPDAARTAQETKKTLTAAAAKLEDSTQPNAEKSKEAKEVQESILQVNAALQAASNVTVAQALNTPAPSLAPNGSPAPRSTPGPQSDPVQAKVDDLIKGLTQADAEKQAKARSELALFGRKAVKPLLELAKQSYDNKVGEDKTLEGVAEVLRNMRQPIQLDRVDAYWVVSMLRSPDQKVRSDTAEFLMNLESSSSVRNCFDALEALFYELTSSFNDGGNAVRNIATIMGTWARNMGKDSPSRDLGKSLPGLALEVARQWKVYLEKSPSSTDWRDTTYTLNELITRASLPAK